MESQCTPSGEFIVERREFSGLTRVDGRGCALPGPISLQKGAGYVYASACRNPHWPDDRPAGPPGRRPGPRGGGSPAPQPFSPQQLEGLVGPIALYPDDLVAIILPAATFPLDIVQAERFLQKVKQDKTLKPDQRWDESVRNLLNYPEVIGMMSGDLDWTQDLGEAVVTQQKDVVKAIQAFRAKAATAGNLKSDDKQVVVQEKEVIKIVPADPEVIYVPQYQPTTVVVQQAAPPPPVYYPTPYPVYYYPYPPGAAMATGFFIGAATAYACNWGGGSVENNVNINNTTNLSTQRTNTQTQQKVNQARQQGQQRTQQAAGAQAGQQSQGGRGQGGASTWQSQKKPGEVSGGRTAPKTAEARPGYSGSGGGSQGDAFGSGGRGGTRRATRAAGRRAAARAPAPWTEAAPSPGARAPPPRIGAAGPAGPAGVPA